MVNCACSHFSRSSSSILKSNPALVSLRYTVSVTPVPVQSSPPFPIPNHSIPCLHTPSVSSEPTINAIRSSTSRFPWPDSGEGKLTSIGHPAWSGWLLWRNCHVFSCLVLSCLFKLSVWRFLSTTVVITLNYAFFFLHSPRFSQVSHRHHTNLAGVHQSLVCLVGSFPVSTRWTGTSWSQWQTHPRSMPMFGLHFSRYNFIHWCDCCRRRLFFTFTFAASSFHA